MPDKCRIGLPNLPPQISHYLSKFVKWDMVIIVGMCCLNFSANRPENLIRILAEFGIRITMIILIHIFLTGGDHNINRC